MKINLMFLFIDILVFLAYPVLYIIEKVRHLMGHGR